MQRDPDFLKRVEEILVENERRKLSREKMYDPRRGDPDDKGRVRFSLSDEGYEALFIPRAMWDEPFVRQLAQAGSFGQYVKNTMQGEGNESLLKRLTQRFIRMRCRHDFEFWAASFVYIKPKGGGPDILFTLNRPQRKLVDALERMRLAGRPIRLIMLKARQWGGSTCVQLYMAWLQMVHMTNLNSLIIAHQGGATDEIMDMFRRMFERYPDWMLAEEGEPVQAKKRMKKSGHSGSSYRIEARDCKIKLGTAQRPDAGRGGDYNLVHCSEVALWPATANKSPEQSIRATTSGVVWKPMTMIVLESTANGTGNFFHREYEAAKRGESPYEPLFVAWYEIDHYSKEVEDLRQFAASLLEGKDNASADSERREPGEYLWHLWEAGASLEAINWYICERMKCSDHADMASEYPSDEVEAFAHSGARVFSTYKIEAMRSDCRAPVMKGELEGDYPYGKRSLEHIRFIPSEGGGLSIWKEPEKPFRDREHLNRYLVVVDIGGRSLKSDWSVIAVFDRFGMLSGGGPEIVAQWRGHADMHILAWNAARIATYYRNALLVIESNTVESRESGLRNDGDQGLSLFQELRETDLELYKRRFNPETLEEKESVRYGFHTNSATKPLIIAGLIKAVLEHLYIERDEERLSEFSIYEKRQNGSYGAIEGTHDDILMTRAIGLHVSYNDMEPPLDCNSGGYSLNDWPMLW